jgi:hypothetical protein
MYTEGDFKIATFATGPLPSSWSLLQDVIGVADIVADPDWSYSPYSEVVRLGSGAEFGRGFAVVEWHWNGFRNVQRENLRVYCAAPDISAQVYICTPTNETLSGVTYWIYALAEMHWPSGNEDKAGALTRDFGVRFTILEEITP